ncbi:SagB family peptide dehydrogenase [Polyangium sp. y55x31]|uniref:SagB family peptide dehydrogenase n=1 Tax=Polyangium sp. y55x31 TaxID=3042688 RepID=UPI002482D1B0|nr:SagB family peptide dehydrogenase [Polyangium sp. y55x31]MDI1480108.1 SagB family peptide dehydrogenase [Polyangium sp. y55x31]
MRDDDLHEARPSAARYASPGRSLCVRLRDGATLSERPDGDLAVSSPFGTLAWKRMPPGLRAAFDALAGAFVTVDALADRVLGIDGEGALPRLYHHLEQLRLCGLLQHAAAQEGVILAEIMGLDPRHRFTIRALSPAQPYLLSRFAHCRREGGRLVLESPVGHARVVLRDPRAAMLVALLAEPHTPPHLAERLPETPEEVVADCLQLLLNADALTTPGEGGFTAEDEDPALAQWGFHDLLFHARSRFGRHSTPFGATFRHVDRIAPLPAVKPPPGDATIVLERPDLERIQAEDPPLARVMEARRSIYTYGEHPITLAQLGEFLYRVARVRSSGEFRVMGEGGHTRARMEVTSRPYPSGGKCYEIELYPIVRRCEGLPGGMYHYDPLHHRLSRVRERDGYVEALLRYASVAAPNGDPQVLIALAARFQRVSWKYDAIAYATTLKHVGVLYQTMYLVATAMGLSPCALGSGDADLFAAASGTRYFAETSVGEFMLGSGPEGGV